ncbi:hypothetical protein [Plantactinospora sp. KBS50]|uniref:hypothetical protein n=1 Tax=Plantactinospora sp. KBS50 TaxID=2024580 RepID=UPI001E54FDC5|nr:hypothetical protein [Plantactinospora sp. KBS50]
MAHAFATRLRAAGEPVDLLTIVDAYPAPPNPTPLDPRHAVAALLISLGITTDALELDAGQALDLATAQGHPVAALGRDRLAAMAITFAANVALQERYAVTRFTGDALLIESDLRHRLDSEAPGSWSPFITGSVDVVRINVPHGALLNPDPAATIAAAVTNRLTPLG